MYIAKEQHCTTAPTDTTERKPELQRKVGGCRKIRKAFKKRYINKKRPDIKKDKGPRRTDEATTYSPAIGSTIGAWELNGRVRDGNGCGLLAIITSSKRGSKGKEEKREDGMP